MLELYIYDAGKGDCLRLRFCGTSGIYHNLLIDSGTTRFGEAFVTLCETIVRSGETIDLLILTHVDADHLGGLLYLVKHHFSIQIATIAMNHPDHFLPAKAIADIPLTALQNDVIFQELTLQKLPLRSLLKGDILPLDGAYLFALHPTYETLCRIFPALPGTDVLLEAGDGRQANLEVLMEKKLSYTDTSLTNAASIVFVFEYNGKKLLFTGDAHSADILAGVRLYAKLRKVDTPVFFDAVKLPHHGSDRNISEEWPSVIQTERFFVCADGTTHPSKLTIAKLLKWYGAVEIYSARDWWATRYFSQTDIQQFIGPGKLRLCCKKGDAIIWRS